MNETIFQDPWDDDRHNGYTEEEEQDRLNEEATDRYIEAQDNDSYLRNL